jgi:hypothetical protein
MNKHQRNLIDPNYRDPRDPPLKVWEVLGYAAVILILIFTGVSKL